MSFLLSARNKNWTDHKEVLRVRIAVWEKIRTNPELVRKASWLTWFVDVLSESSAIRPCIRSLSHSFIHCHSFIRCHSISSYLFQGHSEETLCLGIHKCGQGGSWPQNVCSLMRKRKQVPVELLYRIEYNKCKRRSERSCIPLAGDTWLALGSGGTSSDEENPKDPLVEKVQWIL